MPPQLPAGPVAIDASFIVALVEKQPAASALKGVLGRSLLCTVNLGEVVYKLAERAGLSAQQTSNFVGSQGVKLSNLTVDHAKRFAELKKIDAAAQVSQDPDAPVRTLSLGDLCCLAVAVDAALPVLTGDKHWLTLPAYGLSVPVFDFRDTAL